MKTQIVNKLFPASPNTKTGYHRVWIRDNIYTILSLPEEKAQETIHALLDIIKKHENKIDWMIKQPTKHGWRYIHPRYDENGNELPEQWGWKQNDAIGALLWKASQTKLRKGDKEILQKIVNYLEAIEYWHDKDNGIWEENEEIHASSIGACLAGLIQASKIVNVPLHLIAHGEHALRSLLPRESITKQTDLALLSLIWPYKIVTDAEREQILKNVEELVREKGLIRYEGDKYYNNGKEAEWTFGFPWLAIIYKNQPNKYHFYLNKAINCLNEKGHLPELYFGGTNQHNENTPLLWAMSLLKLAQ